VAAVRAPAPHLVSEAVAEAVVRFVAGGADLAHAEVEPSLLSLICRELNNTRLAQGHAEISADLLAGSRDTILAEFYERALADQPAGVRIFIEDEMLTDSGYRESVAEERVRKAFVAAGAAPGALAALVDRRLLRVEDRLDLRRVEITHDVLCSVVGASRGVRHEREALEESKRQLVLQQERERATRRALLRARVVAAVASVLMLLAAGSAVFGWINLRRARMAEAQTETARHLAELARTESEKLVGFLLEDFYEELKPTGRVEIVGKLADKAVAYYDGLPPELMTPQTRLYRGMALVRKASALADGGKVAEATQVSDEARKIFEPLRAASGNSDETTTALALALFSKTASSVFFMQTRDLEEAAALLRPLVKAGRASRSAKLAYADILSILAHSQDRVVGLATCEESRKILADLGALDLTDLTAASAYGDVTDTQARLSEQLGRYDEAQRLAEQVGDIAEKVLERRPGDLRAMINRYYSANVLGNVAYDRNQFPEAETHYTKSEEAARNYALFNPADNLAWRNWNQSNLDIGETLAEQGQVAEALRHYHLTAARENDPRNKTGSDIGLLNAWQHITQLEAQGGDLRAARAAHAEVCRVSDLLIKERNLDQELTRIATLGRQLQEFDILAAEGDYATIHARAVAIADQLGKVKEMNKGNQVFRFNTLRSARTWQIESALRLGRAEEAVTVASKVVNEPMTYQVDLAPAERMKARARVRLGQGLVAVERRAEALAPLGEALVQYRTQQAGGAHGATFRHDFARALHEAAEAQGADDAGRAQRRALLDEAAGVLGGLSFEAQQLGPNKELIQWVSAARAQAHE
jgi:tetratricopeptide (TPR) repeat protein